MTIEIFDDYDLQTLEPDFDAMEDQLAHFAFLPGMLDYINKYMPAWVHAPFEDEEEYFKWAVEDIQRVARGHQFQASRGNYGKKIKTALKLRSIGVHVDDYTLSAIPPYDLLNIFWGYFIGKPRFGINPKVVAIIPKEESFHMMFTRDDSTPLVVFHAGPIIQSKKPPNVYVDSFEWNSTVRMTHEDESALKDAMSAWVYVASKVTGIKTKDFYREQHGPVPVNYWVVEELEKKEKKS